MKKQLLIHFASFIIVFLVTSLLRTWITPPFIAFWLGGLIGTILPDIDHLLYVYYLRPHELSSQRVAQLLKGGKTLQGLDLLIATASERRHLIFHNAWFQVIFLILMYWVFSSASSLFGRGLVLGFSLHLLVDQLLDLLSRQSLDSWFSQTTIRLTKEKSTFYWLGMAAILLLMAILL